jgi:hypothetical protein
MKLVALDCDFAVAGGGLAGLCAAITAARNGSRTVLVHDRSVLGGNASSEIKMHVVGADCHGSRPGARETGLIEELRLEDSFRNPGRCYSLWDVLLYEKAILEPNLTLLLDTACTGCETVQTEGGKRSIRTLQAIRTSTEEEFLISARFFADCTGDGALGASAGAEFMRGREAKADFGESLALDQSDGKTLGSSILLTGRRCDSPQRFIAPPWIRKFHKDEFKHRPIQSYEYGYWWFEWGGHLDTIADSPTSIRHELLRIALGVWDYIKNSGDHPDAAHWALEWVGSLPGKRESRRFLGQHVLTQNDVFSGRCFDDAVAYGGWWVDLHPPMGIDAADEAPCEQIHFPHLFTIPLRCLHSRNVENLFFAGRNISATHVAFASTRVMATCAVAGQAVGTAAAILAKGTEADIAVLSTPETVSAIQQTLLRDDAFLPGITNNEPVDLARQSIVSASDMLPEHPPEAVIDGIARPLPEHLGPWADGKAHAWKAPSAPAWIELTWNDPVCVSEIHLCFDSGLDRELMLSASDHASRKIVRGPQPEIVKHYELRDDEGNLLASCHDNHQRRRVHKFTEPQCIRSLRCILLETHGNVSPALQELRVYAHPSVARC